MTRTDPQKAGVVVLRQAQTRWLCLLLHARGEWDFPKGAIETGEAPLAAAAREVMEETAISNLEFRWGHVFTETPVRDGRSVVRFYIAVTSAAQVYLPISTELGYPEHDEFQWVTFEDACHMLEPRRHSVVAWAGQITQQSGAVMQ